MSIPKIIHYCWFGGGAISPENRKCMGSWKKYCPDYKIIEWNDQNFDISTNRYAQQAYEAKKYAFVSDYARLAVLYEYGGIYLDTDVELVRPLDELLELPGFMGFQTNNEVATGLGFGARKGNSVVQALLRDYDALDFLKADGSADLTPCPERNTRVLQALGVRKDGTRQSIAEMEIFPADYFCYSVPSISRRRWMERCSVPTERSSNSSTGKTFKATNMAVRKKSMNVRTAVAVLMQNVARKHLITDESA